jgi:2-methylaconitate cis-trans-isomerase PrpF
VRLDFLDPGGAGTGKLLPTGSTIDDLEIPGLGRIEASMVDAANPCVFVAAETLAMTGVEMPDELEANPELLARLDAIRITASLRMGIAKTGEEAARKPSIPKIAVVAGPREAHTLSGEKLEAEAADVTIRMISIGQPHRAVPLTGAMCLALVWKRGERVSEEAQLSRRSCPYRATVRSDDCGCGGPPRWQRLARRACNRLSYDAAPDGWDGMCACLCPKPVGSITLNSKDSPFCLL